MCGRGFGLGSGFSCSSEDGGGGGGKGRISPATLASLASIECKDSIPSRLSYYLKSSSKANRVYGVQLYKIKINKAGQVSYGVS